MNCLKCNADLQSHWLKDGICNGCRNPHLIVTSNVVSITKARDKANDRASIDRYRQRIASLDKLALLDEMVKFQQERSRLGHLTMEMVNRGIILFKALEFAAETKELKLLTRSYLRHLEIELNVKRN